MHKHASHGTCLFTSCLRHFFPFAHVIGWEGTGQDRRTPGSGLKARNRSAARRSLGKEGEFVMQQLGTNKKITEIIFWGKFSSS